MVSKDSTEKGVRPWTVRPGARVLTTVAPAGTSVVRGETAEAASTGTVGEPRREASSRSRFPRGDQELRERPAFVLPGWLAGAALLACAAGGVWVAAVDGNLPGRVMDHVSHRVPLTPADWITPAVTALCIVVAIAVLGGLTVVRSGTVRVLSRFGRYRGTVRRSGVVWTVPLARRRRVDVRLRHWRSRPMGCVDRQGTPLRVVVLVVWQVRDAARAAFAVRDHEAYLKAQIESAVGAVMAELPCDSFAKGDGEQHCLRDSAYVSDELTRRLAGAVTAIGVEVFSAQTLHIEYAPEVADQMLRRRVAGLDAQTRTAVLDDVVDTVTAAVERFTRRDLVRLDESSRTDFVRDLTVAMYSARTPTTGAAPRD